MGMEIDSSDTANKDTLFIIFTVVLFGFSFALSLIGYYIGQIVQSKTNVIIKNTVDIVGKKKKHNPRDAKKMIDDVTDLTGLK
jgi:putative Mn2+ efflux pump MntP